MAGGGHLHAVVALRHVGAGVQWRSSSAVLRAAGSRERLLVLGKRPAPSGDAEWHLASRSRVPAERAVLLWLRAAYNLFNHENCGNYEVRESNANYGRPIPLLSLAYQPRMLQLGFRTTF